MHMQYFEHHIYTSSCRVVVQVLIKKENHTESAVSKNRGRVQR
jgi:hypothetical protein